MKFLKELMLRNIAGEAILVPVGTSVQEFNGMITLTPVAKTIWENIENVETTDEIVQIVLDEYEVDEETARTDVEGFIQALKDIGFVGE